MTTLSDGEDWREAIDSVDAGLIDGYQSGFPVCSRPFRAVGEALGVTEMEAFRRSRRLLDTGIFRRFGPVLNPPVIGSSTLGALAVPEDRFDEVAAVVNGYPQVNHNYRRSHEWNMWFVVTAGSLGTRNRILNEIEQRTGLDVLNLPMLIDFYIDLEFPVVNDDRFAGETPPGGVSTAGRNPGQENAVRATHIEEAATIELSSLERALLLEVQDGFPLSTQPYRDVADVIGVETGQVLDGIGRLLSEGCIKRIGFVVDHVAAGFDANCMVVWAVPDGDLVTAGEAAGRLPYVTLCYHRPERADQDWPYNLFTMIHGRDQAVVARKVDELAADTLPYNHERLYSEETLKQTGARYEHLVGD